MPLESPIRDELTVPPASGMDDRCVPEALVLEELARMVASKHFRMSRRCKEFLHYVVNQKVIGNGGLLKERLIGVEIFGRKPDYPVGEDPVVRVLAGDVRHRLERYHADPDCSSAILIEIPLGSYAPVFTFRKEQQAADLTAHEPLGLGHLGVDSRSALTPSFNATNHDRPSAMLSEERPLSDASKPAPSGSLQGQQRDAVPTASPLVQRGGRLRRATVLLASLAALAGVLAWSYVSKQNQTMSKFWSPASASQKPVLLWLPKPMVYRPSDALFEKYEKAHPSAVVTREGRQDKYLPLDPGETIAWSDMVPIQDAGPGTGGVIAAVNMSRLLTEQGIRFEIRFGPEANYAEMRESPAVIVGAINADWATQLTSESHFAFDESIASPNIYETTGARRVWKMEVNHGHKIRDYGLITRQLSGKSGQFVVQVAGISHFGTEAASEFLLEKGELERVLHAESIGLQKKNLQIIVSTDITNEHAGPPHVVAIDSW